MVKPQAAASETGSQCRAQFVRDVLYMCITCALRLIHPFMPFLSEELYQRLPKPSPVAPRLVSLCLAPYPTPDDVSGARACVCDFSARRHLCQMLFEQNQSFGHYLGLNRVLGRTNLVQVFTL